MESCSDPTEFDKTKIAEDTEINSDLFQCFLQFVEDNVEHMKPHFEFCD